MHGAGNSRRAAAAAARAPAGHPAPPRCSPAWAVTGRPAGRPHLAHTACSMGTGRDVNNDWSGGGGGGSGQWQHASAAGTVPRLATLSPPLLVAPPSWTEHTELRRSPCLAGAWPAGSGLAALCFAAHVDGASIEWMSQASRRAARAVRERAEKNRRGSRRLHGFRSSVYCQNRGVASTSPCCCCTPDAPPVQPPGRGKRNCTPAIVQRLSAHAHPAPGASCLGAASQCELRQPSRT